MQRTLPRAARARGFCALTAVSALAAAAALVAGPAYAKDAKDISVAVANDAAGSNLCLA